MDALQKSFDPDQDSSRRYELTDEQWALVAPVVSTSSRRDDSRGRPWREPREVLSGILWVLRHNAPWRALPDSFPSHQTCRRRFQQWLNDGRLKLVLEALAEDLRLRGGIDLARHLPEDVQENFENVESDAWKWRTAMLFFSPATQKLLRRVQSPLAKRISPSHRRLIEGWPGPGVAFTAGSLILSQTQLFMSQT